ncbi:MAG: potassium channel family protein, partial [Bdellovibrionales bacterium]|nr:potassium channel family protein [Bdellovibrionales bacterium]
MMFQKRIITLFRHPLFWALTMGGNGLILLGGALLYYLESAGGHAIEFVDSLLWSTSIVTTIGYGDYTPQTLYGKITVIVLMLLGTFFVWSYMALLVSALVSPALSALEKEVQDVEKEISGLRLEE